MSLEQALAENTAAIKELTAALLASGALQSAQASAALHSAPGVQAVAAAQRELKEKEADAAKKQEAAATDASAGAAATNESSKPGAASAPTPTSSNDAQPSGELQPWAAHTAEIYGELKDAAPTLENIKRLIVTGLNSKIPTHGRAIAEAVLARFGANAVSEKPGKRGLSEDQYADVLAYGLRVLAGELDPREAEQAAA
ncbi:hypothetical protein U0E23_10005 [Burkholderia stagnalis]|uniref:hypothetical protein n=1 Tax=Burkholderia stagnalis TaxID=1503054 RepID=UPI002AB48E87|nr:hypothetical protein [Burkholderia stagnalis]MDY7802799.1 hypothetical protein [Burkholderia stagnalis]